MLFKSMNMDLVVTDIIMPGREGLETIINMKGLKPETPIVAVSGFEGMAGRDFLHYAEKFGARATFRKPFDTRQFISTIQELVHA